MGEEQEARCPYCNGTGRLPARRVHQIEADRDEQAVRLHKIGLLWGALSNLAVDASKKTMTLEKLQARIRRAHGSGFDLSLAERVGHRTEPA